ncbi:hypothetical protein CRU94_08655 [Arcobacter sp. AHV-9/2010]|uniref:hypothetical protein n=1 Tax=Arcobacter sp. AHV-9/2010 TaxID=2021861 RepID=UPI00100BCE50|nr:hypothetical protein [Arcobacter sp. CECT 9299]RXJ94509.1 hypothetical protein CRU94_08655 [Arcobacter sp. CECT 9299]
MLNYLNNSFINSKIKTKTQLVLLPILIFFLIFTIFNNTIFQNSLKNEDSKIYDILNKKNSTPLIEISKQIGEIANENKVFIQKIENFKDEIRVVAKSSKNSLIKFLIDIENFNDFSNISSFTLKKVKSDDYFFDLNIDFSKYYIKTKQNIIRDLISKNSDKKDLKNKIPKLTAIIGDFVLIDNIWIENGDFYKHYRVKIVNNNIVLLEFENQKLELKVHQYESVKN